MKHRESKKSLAKVVKPIIAGKIPADRLLGNIVTHFHRFYTGCDEKGIFTISDKTTGESIDLVLVPEKQVFLVVSYASGNGAQQFISVQ